MKAQIIFFSIIFAVNIAFLAWGFLKERKPKVFYSRGLENEK